MLSAISKSTMRLVSYAEYTEFLSQHAAVIIGNNPVKLENKWAKVQAQPTGYSEEETTIWNFPDRGTWATHVGSYPGNWSPFVPRNLINRYSKSGDLVVDPMVGGGTTLVECKLLERRGIGVDVNLNACMIAMNRLDFVLSSQSIRPSVEVYNGDARNLNLIMNGNVDLVLTHPPYGNIIKFSAVDPNTCATDLSSLPLDVYIDEMNTVAHECFRILKCSGYCAILIGATRVRSHHVPIHVAVLTAFLRAGFVLKEEIVKIQHATRSSRTQRASQQLGFYMIAHEHLYVFRKPSRSESAVDYRFSSEWW